MIFTLMNKNDINVKTKGKQQQEECTMELISKLGYEKLCKQYKAVNQEIENAKKKMVESLENNGRAENLEYNELWKNVTSILPDKKEEIFKRMKECMIIEDCQFFEEFDGSKVIPGSKVTFTIDGENETLTILGEYESDVENGIISLGTPMAKALLGRYINEMIVFNGMTIIIKAIERI